MPKNYLLPRPAGRDEAARAEPRNSFLTPVLFAGVDDAAGLHGDAINKAIDLLKKGASPEEVFKQTGYYISPEGRFKFEIDDRDAKLKVDPKKAGEYKLSDVIDHPEYFKYFPKDANFPVRFAPLPIHPLGFPVQGQYRPGQVIEMNTGIPNTEADI